MVKRDIFVPFILLMCENDFFHLFGNSEFEQLVVLVRSIDRLSLSSSCMFYIKFIISIDCFASAGL